MKCRICRCEIEPEKTAHPTCQEEYKKLQERLYRRNRKEPYNEVSARLERLTRDAEWLLRQRSERVLPVVGDEGMDIVLDVSIRLTKLRGLER